MSKIIHIHPDNPQERLLQRAIECLKDGGVIIYPTDTVYGFGCDLYNMKAIERICKIKGTDPRRMHLSFICDDLSDISTYAKVSTPVFKAMKRALPGPYTFILESSTRVPKILHNKKKQVGIRIPDHAIPRQLVQALGNPILTTSVKHPDDEILEYLTEAYQMEEAWGHHVDLIIDGGTGGNIPSTVLSGIGDEIELIRQGLGQTDQLL
ncbi:MAG: L-threonylcarbamoyladenylate synthase [Bernardetiaceae bacterium]